MMTNLAFILFLLLEIPLLFLPVAALFPDDFEEKHQNTQVDSNSLRKFLNALEDSIEKSPAKAYHQLIEAESVFAQDTNESMFREYLFVKARYYDLTSRYQTAIKIYLKCAHLANLSNDDEHYLRALNNVAVLYARLNQFAQSNQQFRQLINEAEHRRNRRWLLIVYVNMANNFLNMNAIDSAKIYYRKALPLTNKGSFYRAAVEINLARLNVKQGFFQTARSYAWRSARYADSTHNQEMYLESLANVVNSYKKENKFDNALMLSQKMMKIAQEGGFALQLTDIYKNMAELYQALHQPQKALTYLNRYVELKDSLFSIEIANRMQELKIQYDTERAEHELTLKKNLLEKRELQIRFLIISFIGVLFFTVIIGILYRRQQKAYRLLVQKFLYWSKQDVKPAELSKENTSNSRIQIHENKLRALAKSLETELIHKARFKEPDLTLEKLALLLNTNSRYLSQIIRELYNMSFPQLLNQLRIKEAIRLLKDEGCQRYSIEGISKMVGFNSRSSFNTAFKKITGMTPSAFRNISRRIK